MLNILDLLQQYQEAEAEVLRRLKEKIKTDEKLREQLGKLSDEELRQVVKTILPELVARQAEAIAKSDIVELTKDQSADA